MRKRRVLFSVPFALYFWLLDYICISMPEGIEQNWLVRGLSNLFLFLLFQQNSLQAMILTPLKFCWGKRGLSITTHRLQKLVGFPYKALFESRFFCKKSALYAEFLVHFSQICCNYGLGHFLDLLCLVQWRRLDKKLIRKWPEFFE